MFQSGYFWGMIAVLFWSTAATVGGVLQGRANFFQIVLIMQGAAFITLATFALREKQILAADIRNILRAGRAVTAVLMTATMALFITIYHSAFYFALQNAPHIQANIINYLWPLFLYISATLILSKSRIGLYELALVILAFSGAFTIAWDPLKGLGAIELRPGLGAALAAALTAPIYMNLSVVLTNKFFSRSYFAYFFSFLLSFPLLLTADLIVAHTAMPADLGAWALTVYLGVGSVALAHFAWTKALNVGPVVSVTNLAYFVPVLSTLLLVVILGDHPSPKLLFGSTLIIIANLLSNEAFRKLHAESGALITFFFVSFFIYFKRELGLHEIVFGSIDFLGQLFAIVSGFFLARMWQKNKEEQATLVSFATELESLIEQAGDTLKGSAPSPLRGAVDRLMTAVSDFDVCRSSAKRALTSESMKAALTELLSYLQKNVPDSNAPLRDELRTCAPRLRNLLNSWIVQKFDRASAGEVVIIFILGMVGAFMVICATTDNAAMDIVSLAFTSCISYIVLKIRDYNEMVTISDYSRLLIVQAPLRHVGLPYYIPDHRLLYNRLRPSELGPVIRYRDENGQLLQTGGDVTGQSLEAYHRSRNVLIGMLMVGILAVMALLLAKY